VWGYDGGLPALGSGLITDAGGDHEEEIGVMRSGVAARQGALIRFWEGGGGGWGDPLTRPAEWVLEDVADGYVSLDAARDIYGVEVRVVDEQAAHYEVDQVATDELRRPG
jgi:N-methylhydantoinase B